MESELDKLARLISAREYLLETREMELRSDYMLQIGQYELQALKCSCEAERMQRKLELAQCTLEAGEPLDEEQIDEQLDAEFAVKEQTIEEMTANMLLSVGYQQMPKPSREELSQMLQSYQQLAKVSYPELYPDDEEKERQWEEITELYRMNNGEALLEKEMELASDRALETVQETLETEQIYHLKLLIQEDIDEILQRFPFNIKDLLEDEEQLAVHREEVQQQAQSADAEIRRLYAKLQLLFEPLSSHLS